MAGAIEWLGDDFALTLGGLVIGLLFGAFAQHSKFCLRAAIIEFAHGALGARVAIWALAFSSAVAVTQIAILAGALNVTEARQLASRGSISGAIIGGALFGVGMVLARGCASRLLVLSATGNLRALVSGLILTIVAQASLRGVLAPMREFISGLWTVEGGSGRSLLAAVNVGPKTGAVLGAIWLAIGVWLGVRNKLAATRAAAAVGVGSVVAGGWIMTYALSQVAFTPVAVSSVTFTGPSADTLMSLINSRSLPSGFDAGLVPGVFLGSLIAALLFREFELRGFEGGSSMARYILGAALMGFGGMLAGGCAVGAGVSGGAIFALTGWVTLATMWATAAMTDRFVDNQSPVVMPTAKAAATSLGRVGSDAGE